MKKKRGAQPGNKNALKHGFYTEAYKVDVSRLLDKLPIQDLSAEINLIRVLSDHYLDSLHAGSEPLDRETKLTALRAVCLSMHTVARLQRLNTMALIMNEKSDELEKKLLKPMAHEQNDLDTP